MTRLTPADDVVRDRQDRGFFGQPRSLANVFGVEMWERFSFYGMQGILLIYLFYPSSSDPTQDGLGLPQATAAGIVGAYGGAVYLATIVGAWLADRLLGPERMLLSSACCVMLGHIALSALPGLWGVAVGLVLIALGSGGVKSNATAIVGTLYRPEDPRRDAGFSLYYLGINLGGLIGPLLTGLLQSTVGFRWGFGVAALGMAVGLAQYVLTRRRLPPLAREVPNPLPRRLHWLVGAGAGLLVVLVAAGILTGMIRVDNLSAVVIAVTAVAAVAYFVVILSSRRITPVERVRVFGFIPLFLASVAFWSLYQQQFTVLTLYADSQLNRDVLGWQIPVSWVQSINPVFIIILSGVFTWVWTRLGARAPAAPVKFGLATVVMGAAFLLFIPWSQNRESSTPFLVIVMILFVFTIAELLLSPVGLSVTTKLAPTVFRTQMVALFMLSIALGTAITGWLSRFYPRDPGAAETRYFLVLGVAAIIVGAILLACAKPVLRLMRGVR